MTVANPKVTSLGAACCGCGACAARCPKFCIAMERDAEGFLRPVVDSSACIGCGACDAVCPAFEQNDSDKVESVYWAKSENESERLASSSGGMFALVAHDVLADGGIVAGAAWAPGCGSVHHVLIEDEGHLASVMRSKYVQSSIGGEVYEGIRSALRGGRRVLFAGTACQVAAMRSYLGPLATVEGFLSVDVICHGVPSPLLWERWAAFKERSMGAVLRAVNMRDKATGWASYSTSYDYDSEKGGAQLSSKQEHDSCMFHDDWYMKAFLANACLRPSCYSCPVKRACGSDLTLGDYWGIQSVHPEVDLEGGVSAVLCNTDRGLRAFEAMKTRLQWGVTSFDKVISGNPSLVRPVLPYVRRDEFMKDLMNGMNIADMMRKYDFAPTLRQRIWGKLRAVKQRLFRVIKRG